MVTAMGRSSLSMAVGAGVALVASSVVRRCQLTHFTVRWSEGFAVWGAHSLLFHRHSGGVISTTATCLPARLVFTQSAIHIQYLIVYLI